MGDDRACLEGIIWVMCTGARWRDVPDGLPSGSTCWRRLTLWTGYDVWMDIWRAFLDELDEQALLDWEECFIDGTFVPAKKGALPWEKPSGARERSLWWWQTVRVFLSEYRSTPPPRRKSHSPKNTEQHAHPCPARTAHRRQSLRQQDVSRATPHTRHRTNHPPQIQPPVQDGRALRRYKRRWIVERSNAWPHIFRRVATRYDRDIHIYTAFVLIACILIALRRL